jgi:hypothetical protein
VRSEFFIRHSNYVPKWQAMNKEARGNFKGLSQADFSKNIHASPFKEVPSIDITFS